MRRGFDAAVRSNVQDNAVLRAERGSITIGDDVVLAHGARVVGPATLGHAASGTNDAAFVGFGSLVEGATISADAMVMHLARVGPGIVVPPEMVVISGKNVRTQAQAEDETLGKVMPITDGLRELMAAVLHVNESFAGGYTELFREDPRNVTGILWLVTVASTENGIVHP